ncbi:hypothetical protein OC834_007626 [Tilletia horrida]|nr:hypothetical protein OC834_007626 [Tilletia horrida]
MPKEPSAAKTRTPPRKAPVLPGKAEGGSGRKPSQERRPSSGTFTKADSAPAGIDKKGKGKSRDAVVPTTPTLASTGSSKKAGASEGQNRLKTKSSPVLPQKTTPKSPQKKETKDPNAPTTVRLHVAGLNPDVSAAELRARFTSFGEVLAVDGWPAGQNALGDPITYAFLTLQTTHGKLSRCLSILNNAAWRGSKLRIGEARPLYSARIAQEAEASAKSGWRAPEREAVEAKFRLEEGGRMLELEEVRRRADPAAVAAGAGNAESVGRGSAPQSDGGKDSDESESGSESESESESESDSDSSSDEETEADAGASGDADVAMDEDEDDEVEDEEEQVVPEPVQEDSAAVEEADHSAISVEVDSAEEEDSNQDDEEDKDEDEDDGDDSDEERGEQREADADPEPADLPNPAPIASMNLDESTTPATQANAPAPASAPVAPPRSRVQFSSLEQMFRVRPDIEQGEDDDDDDNAGPGRSAAFQLGLDEDELAQVEKDEEQRVGGAPSSFSILGGLALDDVEMDEEFEFGREEGAPAGVIRRDADGVHEDGDAAGPSRSPWQTAGTGMGASTSGMGAQPAARTALPFLFPRFEGVDELSRRSATGAKDKTGKTGKTQRAQIVAGVQQDGLRPVRDERNPAYRLLFRDLSEGITPRSEQVLPFHRTESLDEIEEQWKATRRVLTQEYKRRHREAVKKQRRRVVGSRATGGVVGIKGHAGRGTT